MREYLGFGVHQPVLLWIFPADNKENSGKNDLKGETYERKRSFLQPEMGCF